MKTVIYLLLVTLTIAIAQESIYEYGQLLEDSGGELGMVSITWKPNGKEYVSYIRTSLSLGDFLNIAATRRKNLNLAYGGLLKEVGVVDNLNIPSNKVEFLNYLGSIGWEFIFIEEGSSKTKTSYYFKKAIKE